MVKAEDGWSPGDLGTLTAAWHSLLPVCVPVWLPGSSSFQPPQVCSYILVLFSSVTQSCPTLWDPIDCTCQPSLSITNSWSLLKLMSIESVMPSNHLILCFPLLLPPSIFPSIRVFSVLRIRWPKYWGFSFSINLSNEYSGLISFRMDWLDLLAVQGILKSLLQHHSSKASIPAELFQILKGDAIKVLHSVCQQIWKTQQWLQDWKRSIFIPIQIKAMPNKVQITIQLCSFHMLAS